MITRITIWSHLVIWGQGVISCKSYSWGSCLQAESESIIKNDKGGWKWKILRRPTKEEKQPPCRKYNPQSLWLNQRCRASSPPSCDQTTTTKASFHSNIISYRPSLLLFLQNHKWPYLSIFGFHCYSLQTKKDKPRDLKISKAKLGDRAPAATNTTTVERVRRARGNLLCGELQQRTWRHGIIWWKMLP